MMTTVYDTIMMVPYINTDQLPLAVADATAAAAGFETNMPYNVERGNIT